jgi:hypothetical protein
MPLATRQSEQALQGQVRPGPACKQKASLTSVAPRRSEHTPLEGRRTDDVRPPPPRPGVSDSAFSRQVFPVEACV